MDQLGSAQSLHSLVYFDWESCSHHHRPLDPPGNIYLCCGMSRRAATSHFCYRNGKMTMANVRQGFVAPSTVRSGCCLSVCWLSLQHSKKGAIVSIFDYNCQCLTKALFVARLRTALRRLDKLADRHAGQSLRRGGATTAGRVGLPETTIKALGGRWRYGQGWSGLLAGTPDVPKSRRTAQ
jgi:hypothetical protein